MNRYLFILAPPYSGSTVLWKLVSTSDHVSWLPGEGQFLPELSDIMRKDPWNADYPMPWEKIKDVWRKHWDLDKPWLVEKSPPHLVRAHDIELHFDPAHFLVMVRDPHAHCASLIRRNKWDAVRAAQFSLRCLTYQVRNASLLRNVVTCTYEQLTKDPGSTARTIERALPGIGTLRSDATFEVHSSLAPDGQVVAKQRIVDHNRDAIKTLGPEERRAIQSVLCQNVEALRFWGYDHSVAD